MVQLALRVHKATSGLPAHKERKVTQETQALLEQLARPEVRELLELLDRQDRLDSQGIQELRALLVRLARQDSTATSSVST